MTTDIAVVVVTQGDDDDGKALFFGRHFPPRTDPIRADSTPKTDPGRTTFSWYPLWPPSDTDFTPKITFLFPG